MGEAKLKKRLAEKCGADRNTRPEETIRNEQKKLWDKVWWNRHMALGEPEAGRDAFGRLGFGNTSAP
jgi:hypothetical protein